MVAQGAIRGPDARLGYHFCSRRSTKRAATYQATLDLIEMLDWLRAVPDH